MVSSEDKTTFDKLCMLLIAEGKGTEADLCLNLRFLGLGLDISGFIRVFSLFCVLPVKCREMYILKFLLTFRLAIDARLHQKTELKAEN